MLNVHLLSVPRNLVSDTRMIFPLSILMLIKLLLTFFLLVNNMNFFFYILSESLLVLNHRDKLVNSLLTVSLNSFRDFDL